MLDRTVQLDCLSTLSREEMLSVAGGVLEMFLKLPDANGAASSQRYFNGRLPTADDLRAEQ